MSRAVFNLCHFARVLVQLVSDVFLGRQMSHVWGSIGYLVFFLGRQMSHVWGFNWLPDVFFSRTPDVAWVGVQFVTWCFF